MAYDVVLVGGGIVGLATARALLRERPGTRLLLLEKESRVAAHQSGHNSGVVHSGVYYAPGTRKARLCRRGRAMLLEYAERRSIPFRVPGKLIVATRPAELPTLDALGARARANGDLECRPLDPVEMRRLEPEVRGLRALLVPGTAILEYPAVARSLASEISDLGGEIALGTTVRGVRARPSGPELLTDRGPVEGRFLVNAAGLQADRLARAAGLDVPAAILPFRGEYFDLPRSFADRIHRLVYPVPDPDLPFLGVHFTPTMSGGMTAGPNAILALAREGYSKRIVRPREALAALAYPGLPRMLVRYPGAAVHELLRSFSRRAFLADLRALVPSIALGDLRPGGSGVRAQAIRPDGVPVDDFLLVDGPNSLHVLNAPSPAATSALAIAEELLPRIPTPPGSGR